MQPASYGDVTVRPIAQKPSLFPDHHQETARLETPEPATPETFIPQAAERPPSAAPRMPKFEDLPMPAQAEIRQARGESAEEEHPQKTSCRCCSASPMSASAAATRKPSRRSRPAPPVRRWPDAAAARTQAPRTVAQQIAANEPVSEYARRPAPQGLDVHGRPAPVAQAPQGDDHLDIPAFLRRQAN